MEALVPLVLMALVKFKVLVLLLVPRILAVKDKLVAPLATADKSTPLVPIVTESVPEFPTITSPAKYTSVFKSRVMVLAVETLSKVTPAMPAEGLAIRFPEVAAVIVNVLFTELNDVCTSESVAPEEERVSTTWLVLSTLTTASFWLAKL